MEVKRARQSLSVRQAVSREDLLHGGSVPGGRVGVSLKRTGAKEVGERNDVRVAYRRVARASRRPSGGIYISRHSIPPACS